MKYKKISKSQTGFSIIEVLISLFFIALLVGIGWRVIKVQDQKTDKKTSAETSSSAPAVGQAEKLTSYCDPIEKSCISYSDQWTNEITKFTDSDGTQRAKAVLTYKNNQKIKIRFSPYIFGIGFGCSGPVTVTAIDQTTVDSGLFVVQSVDINKEVEASEEPQDFYTIGLAVASSKQITGSGEDIIKLGDQECNFLAHYDNKAAKHDGIGTLSVTGTGEFKSREEAADWFKTKEATESIKVLRSLKI